MVRERLSPAPTTLTARLEQAFSLASGRPARRNARSVIGGRARQPGVAGRDHPVRSPAARQSVVTSCAAARGRGRAHRHRRGRSALSPPADPLGGSGRPLQPDRYSQRMPPWPRSWMTRSASCGIGRCRPRAPTRRSPPRWKTMPAPRGGAARSPSPAPRWSAPPHSPPMRTGRALDCSWRPRDCLRARARRRRAPAAPAGRALDLDPLHAARLAWLQQMVTGMSGTKSARPGPSSRSPNRCAMAATRTWRCARWSRSRIAAGGRIPRPGRASISSMPPQAWAFLLTTRGCWRSSRSPIPK